MSNVIHGFEILKFLPFLEVIYELDKLNVCYKIVFLDQQFSWIFFLNFEGKY